MTTLSATASNLEKHLSGKRRSWGVDRVRQARGAAPRANATRRTRELFSTRAALSGKR
jgi:hypothetical protein